MSFFPADTGNSATQNSLAGFNGSSRIAEKREDRKGREKEGQERPVTGGDNYFYYAI